MHKSGQGKAVGHFLVIFMHFFVQIIFEVVDVLTAAFLVQILLCKMTRIINLVGSPGFLYCSLVHITTLNTSYQV
jgi:hypothetical protein